MYIVTISFFFILIINNITTPRKLMVSGGTAPRILHLGTGCKWLDTRPGHFTPGKSASAIQWTGGRVSPRAGLDAVAEKALPVPGIEFQSSSP
jgi:hypothetical protein